MHQSRHRICVAPMMDWTDRHCRYFLRQISRCCLLYTEMVTAEAIKHGDPEYLLGFHPDEQPVALQLGGSDPEALANAAKIGRDFGYCEINLNVGCPSDRVQQGRFGVCLMTEPDLVADCVSHMQSRVDVPVTVKTRIGVDHEDSFEFLERFVGVVAATGCNTFIIHARKAWLTGLSPKQNRTVPPLNYDRVYALKDRFPGLKIVINGGIATLDEADAHLQKVDGVMLGRSAYQNPFLLSDVDRRFFGSTATAVSRADVVLSLQTYIAEMVGQGIPIKRLTRHMMGMFQGQPGARAWRRSLSAIGMQEDASFEAIEQALASMDSTSSNHARMIIRR